MSGKQSGSLSVVHPDCAGVDIGKRKHHVAMTPDRFEEPVRHFASFAHVLQRWRRGPPRRPAVFGRWRWSPREFCWIPVFEVLDWAGFAVVHGCRPEPASGQATRGPIPEIQLASP